MSLIKKLASQTLIYGLSSIVGRFLNYLLVPLYTNIFLAAEYGVSSWFYAFASFGGVVFTYGMETAYFRFSQKGKEKDGGDKVFATAMWSLLLSSLLLGSAIGLLATPLANFTRNNGRELFFMYYAMILAADAITTLPFARLRQKNEALRFALLRLGSIGINIGLNLFFYVYQEQKDISYMFLANVASSVLILPFFYKEFWLLRLGFDAALWQKMLNYAYPLIFMGMAGMVNETIDRILLKLLITDQTIAETQIGIYGANYKLSILITLFIQAFRMAAEPFFFARSNDKKDRKIYADVMKYFVIVCSIIFLMVTLYIDVFKYYIGRDYWSGLGVVPILLVANVCLGVYYNLSIWYKLTDKTQMGAAVALLGALITLILNWLWIPQYGYEGSAWATLCCYAAMMVVSYYLGQKYFSVPYSLTKIVGYFGTSILIFLVTHFIYNQLLLNNLYIKFSINSFFFVSFLFWVYQKELKLLIKR